jgi:predicted RNase H-like nuclease (RuvC/YqgF family)
MLISTKDNEIDKLVNRMNNLELCIKEKEKIIQFLQIELKTFKYEFKEEKMISKKYL